MLSAYPLMQANSLPAAKAKMAMSVKGKAGITIGNVSNRAIL
ncbi:hypothetical protein ACQUQU_17870 [Thalassolituus sp. LLYu03]